jgi:CDGSH-type Zn-finger protein
MQLGNRYDLRPYSEKNQTDVRRNLHMSQIRARKNGPYLLAGSVTYLNAEGETQETGGKSVALCHCSGSANKPSCDGTYRRNGFEAAAIELTSVE